MHIFLMERTIYYDASQFQPIPFAIITRIKTFSFVPIKNKNLNSISFYSPCAIIEKHSFCLFIIRHLLCVEYLTHFVILKNYSHLLLTCILLCFLHFWIQHIRLNCIILFYKFNILHLKSTLRTSSTIRFTHENNLRLVVNILLPIESSFSLFKNKPINQTERKLLSL